MQVNITERIDTSEGKRYSPVIVGPNGRIEPDWVMVNDRQEKHPEGTYYLDCNEDGNPTAILGNAYFSLRRARAHERSGDSASCETFRRI